MKGNQWQTRRGSHNHGRGRGCWRHHRLALQVRREGGRCVASSSQLIHRAHRCLQPQRGHETAHLRTDGRGAKSREEVPRQEGAHEPTPVDQSEKPKRSSLPFVFLGHRHRRQEISFLTSFAALLERIETSSTNCDATQRSKVGATKAAPLVRDPPKKRCCSLACPAPILPFVAPAVSQHNVLPRAASVWRWRPATARLGQLSWSW